MMRTRKAAIDGYSFFPNSRVETLVAEVGSFRYGHTILTTGHHTTGFITSTGFLSNPKALYKVAQEMAAMFDRDMYDFVVGPLSFDFQLASYVALVGDKPCTSIFIPLDKDGRYDIEKGNLNKSFVLPEGKRALIITDCIGTGMTINAIAEYLNSIGVEIAGVGAIFVDTLRFENKVNLRINAFFPNPFERFSPQECDLCANGDPLVFIDINE